jgi:enamine deaminase RidA (YjgF/YER057c/UK114 family)
MSITSKLASMGLSLPAVPKPVASYVPAVRTGDLVYCSGQLPTVSGELQAQGRVGIDVSEDDARRAARVAALNCLAAITSVVGDIDRIRRIVRVNGYVTSTETFVNQSAVIDGASDFLVELFGEVGQHSRAAIGVYQLPRGASVEIDMIVEVAD